MSKATIYLCGAITEDPATWSWREDAARGLDFLYDLDSFNPLRGKDLSSIKELGFVSNVPGNIFVARDLHDIQNAKAMLCNFLIIPDRQMVGSLFEIGYATALGKPYVVAATDRLITEHPFIKHTALDIVPTLEEAVETIGIIFSDGRNTFTSGGKLLER